MLYNLGKLPADMVAASFGGYTGSVKDLFAKVPPPGTGASVGSADCLKKCGL
jgi:hypothetical protein